jgi:hypothetical protein
MQVFVMCGLHVLPEWPPYSADLNIIEIVWTPMGRIVDKERPETLEALKDSLLNTWEHFLQITINALVNSMNQRLRQLIANGG